MMIKVRQFSSHNNIGFALRSLQMLRFIIATFYCGEDLFYLTVRENVNNSQLRNVLFFFFNVYLFKFKKQVNSPRILLKKC